MYFSCSGQPKFNFVRFTYLTKLIQIRYTIWSTCRSVNTSTSSSPSFFPFLLSPSSRSRLRFPFPFFLLRPPPNACPIHRNPTMGSVPDPGEVSDPDPPLSAAPSFDDFQRQTSLMTSCTLLWKELSDHFTSLEQNFLRKSESLKLKLRTLEELTENSLSALDNRETTIDDSISMEIDRVERNARMSLEFIEKKRKEAEKDDEEGERPEVVLLGEVDDGEGLLTVMRKFCLRMEAREFLRFLTGKKKEIDLLREKMPAALAECVDPAKFVLEAISEVFPIDKRVVEFGQKGVNAAGSGIGCVNDMGWACVLMLESLIPVVVDPVIGKQRIMVTPSVREKAKEIAETWKESLEERGGIENVRTPDVHTFLQHLVTFGIVKEDDLGFYRKLVIASAWRKQMPKLAVSLGLESMMPGTAVGALLIPVVLSGNILV